MMLATVRQYLKTHGDNEPKPRQLPQNNLTMRNVFVTDATVLLTADKQPNPTPFKEIVCLHPAGAAQRDRVLKSFETIRPQVANTAANDTAQMVDLCHDACSDDDDEVIVADDVDWDAKLEAVLTAPAKNTRKRQAAGTSTAASMAHGGTSAKLKPKAPPKRKNKSKKAVDEHAGSGENNIVAETLEQANSGNYDFGLQENIETYLIDQDSVPLS